MRQLLDHAAEHDYGIPAFNVNNLEQVQAIMSAAAQADAPVIMQASAGARKYAGEAFLRHLIEAAVESFPHVPVVMHQDHGQSPAVCLQAMRLGFSSVMMDGSLLEDGKTIASYDYNVSTTKAVVDMAHAIGVTVEGELGCLGSLETMKGDKEDGHGAEGSMTREQLLISFAKPRSTRLRLRSAHRTAPINSAENQRVIFWRLIGLRRFTAVYPILIW
jgi:fructose-bisphosphate aldolase class II